MNRCRQKSAYNHKQWHMERNCQLLQWVCMPINWNNSEVMYHMEPNSTEDLGELYYSKNIFLYSYALMC